MNTLLQTLGVDLPIVQAQMAGVSTPAMAAAVSNAGRLGSIGVGAVDAETARGMIQGVRAATDRPFNVNVFCHRPAVADHIREAAWLARLAPQFARFGAEPPEKLREVYTSFVEDDAMLAVLLEERPRVVSFHFGLPPAERIAALRDAGIVLLATATRPEEARAVAAAGIDAVVAQGFEAGGHRGVFDPEARDGRLGTLPLTVLTTAISGRPARCLANLFTALGEEVGVGPVPAYPIAYDAGKALDLAAKAAGESGFGAQWAGQGAPLARSLPAATLVAVLRSEMEQALSRRSQ